MMWLFGGSTVGHVVGMRFILSGCKASLYLDPWNLEGVCPFSSSSK